jgi:hypothetical protein
MMTQLSLRRKEVACENLARSAKPVLDALYQYRHENGLWPTSLKELTPKYLGEPDVNRWNFSNDNDGYWRLTSFGLFPDAMVHYSHLKNKGGKWRYSDGEWEHDLQASYKPPQFPVIAAHIVNSNRVAQFEFRIAKDPKRIFHRVGYVNMLMNQELYERARSVCIDCEKEWPDHWWPKVTIAVLEAKCGNKSLGEERLRMWVEKHDTFTHYYFLAYYYTTVSEHCMATMALEKAILTPMDMESDASRPIIPTDKLRVSNIVYFQYAAILAYRLKQLDLCLQICDRWEYYEKTDIVRDVGFSVFRAACYLNQGRCDSAIEFLDGIVADDRFRYGFDRGFRALRQAASRMDVRHQFDPRRDNDGKYYEPVGTEVQIWLYYE